MPINPTLLSGGAAARNPHGSTTSESHELDQLREAVRLTPYRATAHEALATALAQRELFAPALDAFEAALRCDPTQVSAILGGGDVLLRQGDVSGARDFMAQHLTAALQALHADIPQLLDMHRLAPLLLAPRLPGPELEQVMQQLANHLAQAAHHALETGHADLSIDLLESVRNFNPAHLGTSHTLADAYLATDQPHLALIAFDACAKHEATHEEKIENARVGARKLLAAGEADYAIVMFRTALTWSAQSGMEPPDQASLLIELGKAEYAAGDLLEASQSFNLSIETHPLGAAYAGRGIIHLVSGNARAAWHDFEAAFATHTIKGEQSEIYQFSRLLMQYLPHAQKPIHWGAESALSLGRLDESRHLFNRLADLLEDNRLAVIGLQRIRLIEGDFQAAQTVLDTMAEEHPDYFPAHCWAARCSMAHALSMPDHHHAFDLFKRTLDHARAALRLNPGHVEAKILAADALLFTRQYDRALRGYDEIGNQLDEPEKSGPLGLQISLQKALLADLIDQPDQALDALVNAIPPQTFPDWDFFLRRAVISLALHRQDAAQPPRSETPPA